MLMMMHPHRDTLVKSSISRSGLVLRYRIRMLEHVWWNHINHFWVDSDHLLIGRKRRPAEQRYQRWVRGKLMRLRTFSVFDCGLVPVSHKRLNLTIRYVLQLTLLYQASYETEREKEFKINAIHNFIQSS